MKAFPRTFAGGIHPAYNKELARDKPLKTVPVPKVVRIPLAQHIGAPSKPVVRPGDKVKVGQVVAEAGGFVSVPQHSSVSGKVKGVKAYPHPLGRRMTAVEIESDGADEMAHPGHEIRGWRSLGADEIKELIRDAGIVGLGGAAFPTHVKLSPPEGKTICSLLINGAECEPFLTCDHRLMLERADEILEGIQIIKKAVGAEKIYIGIEENKPDAIELFRQKMSGDVDTAIVPCEVKYPQGSELQLMKSVLDVSLPKTKLPMEAGVVVQNVGTALAVYEAVVKGKPLYERAVTISGPGISEPGNFMVRIGTLFDDVIAFAGGVKPGVGNMGKIIMGGPMMGLAQHRTDVPVIKGTSGIVLLPGLEMERETHLACIRCGRCESTCPMNLPVARIGLAVEFENYGTAEELAVMECIECGCCSYVCPSVRPMTQFMRIGKASIMEKRAKEKAGSGK